MKNVRKSSKRRIWFFMIALVFGLVAVNFLLGSSHELWRVQYQVEMQIHDAGTGQPVSEARVLLLFDAQRAKDQVFLEQALAGDEEGYMMRRQLNPVPFGKSDMSDKDGHYSASIERRVAYYRTFLFSPTPTFPAPSVAWIAVKANGYQLAVLNLNPDKWNYFEVPGSYKQVLSAVNIKHK